MQFKFLHPYLFQVFLSFLHLALIGLQLPVRLRQLLELFLRRDLRLVLCVRLAATVAQCGRTQK